MIDPTFYEEKEFTCPKCGSHSFGTADYGYEGSELSAHAVGHCNGEKCSGYNWLRSNDASSGMRGTGVFKPRTIVLENVIVFSDTLDALIVDDERVRHDAFSKEYIENNIDHAWTYNEAINLLGTTKYKVLQLDHDLADFTGNDGRELTGYDVMLYVIGYVNKEIWPECVIVHSHNPVGAQNIVKLCSTHGINAAWEPFRIKT